MFNHLIFILLFVLLLNNDKFLTKSEKLFKRYSCDNQEKINELDYFEDNLKRLIRHDNKLYFVFKDRIVFTKLFEIDEYELQFFDVSTMVIGNFYEQEVEEDVVIQGIPGGANIIGHFFIEPTKSTYEFYSAELDLINLDAYDLDFKGDKLAKRARRIEYTRIRKNKVDIEQLFNDWISNGLRIKYFDLNLVANDNEYTISYFTNKLYIRYINEDLNKDYVKVTPKFYVTYSGNQKDYNRGNSRVVYLVSIDNTSSIINFNNYLIYNKVFGGIAFDWVYRQTSMSLKQLFSCHVQFKTEWEIKGIFFHEKSKTYYLFINRFYLQIVSDLLKSKFKLTKEMFQKYAHDLFFEDTEANKGMHFSVLFTRWIYAVGNKTYIRTNLDTYELNADEKTNDLQIKKTEFNGLQMCFRQTLVIEGLLYCFDEDDYFTFDSWGRPRYKVGQLASIFEGSNIGWDQGQILSLIFNYESGYVVFLTLTHSFILEYKYFKKNGFKLTYEDPNANEFVIKTESCIFNPDTCKPPPRITVTNKPNQLTPSFTGITTKKSKTKRSNIDDSFFDFYDYLVMLLILILVLILLTTYSLIKDYDSPPKVKRKISKVFQTMYPVPKTGISSVAPSAVSSSKLASRSTATQIESTSKSSSIKQKQKKSHH